MAQTGLILQGGGALGAYELGALKRLYEEPGFKPNVISGVSIGAITAATLVGAKQGPIETLEALWDSFTMPSSPFIPEEFQQLSSLFGDPSFYRMRMDLFNSAEWTSYYDTSPLRGTLQEFVDFQKIRDSDIDLFVTATNVQNGSIEVFDNHNDGYEITPDHILASGALPPGFPMIEINHSYYWDGGLFNNTPLSPVIEKMKVDTPSEPKEVVVINLFPKQGAIPKNLLEVRDRTLEITYSNKLLYDVDQTRRINEYIEVIEAIDKALPPDSPIRKQPGYERLKQYTLINDIVHIENNDPEVATGAFDFSKRSIERRVDAGYRDADAVLKAKPARKLPKGMLRASSR